MAKKTTDHQNIILDIVDACSIEIDRSIAIKGMRTICRNYGGGMYYFPANKKNGRFISEVRETLKEAVGETSAEIIIDKMMALLGYSPVYIPFEKGAFRDIVAEEIYIRNVREGVPVSQLFRDYGLTTVCAYKLWKEGQKIILRKEKKK